MGICKTRCFLFQALSACAAVGPFSYGTVNVFANEFTAAGKITSVTVYSDRALITMSAKVQLPAGRHSIAFLDLPAALQEDSVSGSVRSGSALISGIELSRQFHGQSPDEKIRSLQREIEKMSDHSRELENRLTVDRRHLEFLDKIQIHQLEAASIDLSRRSANTEEWNKMLTFLDRNRTERLQSILRTEIEIRELSAVKRVKDQELSQLSSRQSTQSRTILAYVNATTPGEASIEIRYVIPGAVWSPSYDVRADLSAGEISLSYFGTVTQRTGEDWRDIELSLSTARPGSGASPPALQPVYLSPGGVIGELRRSRGRTEREIDGTEDQPADHSMEQSSLESRGPSALYRVPGTQTIPSAERPRRVGISEGRFPAVFTYICLPKLAPNAFLRAAARNNTANQLLTGPVNVFLSGDFVGRSVTTSVSPGQEFSVDLGIDERMKVKRESIIDKSSTTFFSKKLVLSQGFKITVENYTGSAQTIRVFDQIPVSQDASIEVKSFRASIAPTEQKEGTGELEWRTTLRPGDKFIVEFQYEVVFPEEVARQAQQPMMRDAIEEYRRNF